MKLHYSFL